MIVTLTNAVNRPIKLTKPPVGVVNWRSMGSVNKSDNSKGPQEP